MGLSIKNKQLVVSNKKVSDSTELIIKRRATLKAKKETKLSEVLNLLPPGIVQKDETGMGATTLELLAPRNSIIVEPIKITASSKAYKNTHNFGIPTLYVGSETKFHPKKPTRKEVLAYLNDPSIQYKKIMVVADSLVKVIAALGPDVYKDYFLLLDEIDSFQMDSTYRKSMEECLDYYKLFDKSNRCMLSATTIEFSDKTLKEEDRTQLSYDIPTTRNILVIKSSTPDLLGNVKDKINEIVSNNPGHKIMVAYNSVKGCMSIAESIKTDGLLNEADIKILCSINSKDKVGKYFEELDSDILPGKLNFVTSAYFTGFDLNETYHLITVSGNKNKVHALSDKRMKQIAGRCRIIGGLITETIIHDLVDPDEKKEDYSIDNLLLIANRELAALICIQNNFEGVPELKELNESVLDSIMKTLDSNNRRFIRKKDSDSQPEISYLNIDSFIESVKSRRELYQNYATLSDKLLSQGHEVKSLYLNTDTAVDLVEIDVVERDIKVNDIIDFLTEIPNDVEILEKLSIGRLTPLQKKIAKAFIEYREYIDNGQLIEKLREKGLKKDSREVNSLIHTLRYTVSAPGDLYKSRMNKYFPIGKTFTSDEILRWINVVLTEINSSVKIQSPIQAVKYLKKHFKTKVIRKGNKQLILGPNPLGITILKIKEEIEDKNHQIVFMNDI
jgi:hypothetical protein